ncbi:hypothetical protein QX204_01095 [Nocardia sp. PE-7]|uniref:hypothetical protein n=1 Tax=Nocardia sp. PE-7 TaxID=3058426 RepID=UPI00265B1990|nr:hypothetical protein [Nocardia sp. PE-7]WKG10136.1 hypothetical protein QX204_01095 [Nocardia sp. PE-7]
MRKNGWPPILAAVAISLVSTSCGNSEPSSMTEKTLFAYSTAESVVVNDGPTEVVRHKTRMGSRSSPAFTSDSRFVSWVVEAAGSGLVNVLATGNGELTTARCRCDRVVAVADGALAWLEKPTDTRLPEHVMRWNPAEETSAPEIWRTLPVWSVPRTDEEYMARQSFLIDSFDDRLLLSGTAFARGDFSASNLLFELAADGSIKQLGALDGMTAQVDGVYSPDGSSVLLYSNNDVDSSCVTARIMTVDLITESRQHADPAFGGCASVKWVRWPTSGPVATVSDKATGYQQWQRRDAVWQSSTASVADTMTSPGVVVELSPTRELHLVREGERTLLGKAVDTVTLAGA